MLFSILKKIKFTGTLVIVDSNNVSHKFGNNNPYVKIRLKSKSLEEKYFDL